MAGEPHRARGRKVDGFVKLNGHVIAPFGLCLYGWKPAIYPWFNSLWQYQAHLLNILEIRNKMRFNTPHQRCMKLFK